MRFGGSGVRLSGVTEAECALVQVRFDGKVHRSGVRLGGTPKRACFDGRPL